MASAGTVDPVGKRRRRVFMGLGALLLLNAIAFGVYTGMSNEQQTTAADAPAVAEPPPEEVEEVDPAVAQHRLAGIEALESQEYDRAVSEFGAALRAGDATPELVRLLGLAQDLRNRFGGSETGDTAMAEAANDNEVEAEALQVVQAEVQRARRSWSARRAPARMWTPRRNPEPAPVADEDPELLVATAEDPVGAETDVIEEPEPAATAEVVAPPVVAPTPPPPAPVEMTPAPRPVAPTTTPRRQRRYGELEVLSPNVVGDVYINGARIGLAPRVVPRVPVGRALVEIRVQGQTRRSKTVRVTEGERIRVRMF